MSTQNETEIEIEEFVCYIDGRKTWTTSPMRCFFATITLFLYNYHFAYFCFALLGIIVIISIFGRIKENYRWFILNQAVWDIAITYSYMQNSKIYDFVYLGRVSTNYVFGSYMQYVLQFLTDIINTNPYSSLLLLSFTRFLALYFMDFYEKLTAKKRIFLLILFFNCFICFFHIDGIFGFIKSKTKTRINLACLKNDDYTFCIEYIKSDALLIFLTILTNTFRICVLLKPIIFLILSIGATVMIVIKIGKQAKFQLQHNRRDFYNSLRVLTVILFQSLINCILVFVEFVATIDNVLSDIFGIAMMKHGSCLDHPSGYFGDRICYDSFQLPEWLDDNDNDVGLAGPTIYAALKQLRIFLESIIILLIMTGYRETINDFFQFFFKVYKKPLHSRKTLSAESRLFVSRSSAIINNNS